MAEFLKRAFSKDCCWLAVLVDRVSFTGFSSAAGMCVYVLERFGVLMSSQAAGGNRTELLTEADRLVPATISGVAGNGGSDRPRFSRLSGALNIEERRLVGLG